MEIFKKINNLIESNKKFVVATVVDIHGSVPGRIGFKLLVENTGKTFGTVGGGALETETVKAALERMKSGKNGLKKYTLTDNPESKSENVVPMSCSGEIEIFYEVFGSEPVVYVFGGGHVGGALLNLLKPLGYYSVLIDNREEFCNADKNPGASEFHLTEYPKFTEEFIPEENSYAVILTHKHIFDYEVLKKFYLRNLKFKYVGVIASKSKAQGIIKKLKEDINPAPDLSNLSIPIGIEIGGDSAEEIALSIAAQIQSIKYGKTIKSVSVNKDY